MRKRKESQCSFCAADHLPGYSRGWGVFHVARHVTTDEPHRFRCTDPYERAFEEEIAYEIGQDAVVSARNYELDHS